MSAGSIEKDPVTKKLPANFAVGKVSAPRKKLPANVAVAKYY
jgi:hypothetical protein